MGWQDRGYNAGREEMKAYFANPLGLMQYALPIFRSAGLSIHLSFWFLLSAVFVLISDLHSPFLIPIDLGLMLGVCLWHELGHRVFARMVGGNHWEWVIWPLGGMVAPTSPRNPKAVFVANVGGIVFNVLLVAAILGVAWGFGGALAEGRVPFLPFGLGVAVPGFSFLLVHCMELVLVQSVGIILMNLYPCYWFDGGHLWQAGLWPFFGQWKAGLITCWAGMILAVPFFLLALSYGLGGVLAMVFWALIFADCFRRRQLLVAAGEGVMEEDEATYNYMDTAEPRRRKRKKSWLGRARKRALADQAEQARIDAILVKVKEHGLHSLTWWEKRSLKKATERQRERDLANRL